MKPIYPFLLIGRIMTAADWPSEYETIRINQSESFAVESNIFVSDVMVNHTWWKEKRFIYGHRHVISNPTHAFSILEPGYAGGCHDSIRSTVAATQLGHQVDCLISANAGFFNMTTSECLGNLISNSELIMATNFKIPSFGLTPDGYLITGYLNREFLKYSKISNLVSGVIWLVRNGKNYVHKASLIEDSVIQGMSHIYYII